MRRLLIGILIGMVFVRQIARRETINVLDQVLDAAGWE